MEDDPTLRISKEEESSEPKPLLKERYEVERELGRGGMSVVFLARDKMLHDKRVVIKVLLEEASQDEWVRRKFHQEMEALARIDHPGVVGVLDTGRTPTGKDFLVMQYVLGANLRTLLPPTGMDFKRAANLIRQTGAALDAAHAAGVLHRDVKPENIMVRQIGGDEHVTLIDFGIAGIANSVLGPAVTKIAGSTAYMAPEQFAGEPSRASDIYALGVVAYEMLTGTRPFQGTTYTHLTSEDNAMCMRPGELRPDLPVAAGRAILKALSFRPERRFGSAREFADELYSALVGDTSNNRAAGPEMAHVLFLDLVGYSLLNMDQQKAAIKELQSLVRQSNRLQQAERSREIVRLPTGDGMALVFFRDPTAPARCALEVAEALKPHPSLQVRMGIHTGPVFRVADINENSNVSGGGINMAQRVMDCGDGGHILVSKAVADVLTQFSDWQPYLTDLGEHQVKHGVTVHIFNLATPQAGNPAMPTKVIQMKSKVEPPPPAPEPPPAAEAAPPPEPESGSTRRIATILVPILLAAAGVAAWKFMGESEPPPPAVQTEIGYWVTVQKYRDGQPYQDPFRLAREMIFEKDYAIALQFIATQDGFLYVLNAGTDGATGGRTLNMLYPRTGDTAGIARGREIRVPPDRTAWFRFDDATGKETCYLVWSRAAIPELEKARALPPDPNYRVVVVRDPASVAALEELLASGSQRVAAKPNDETKTTQLTSSGDVLVHKIELEHH
ncbi:MAG: protein kinase [Bryobacteraceae bacterium]